MVAQGAAEIAMLERKLLTMLAIANAPLRRGPSPEDEFHADVLTHTCNQRCCLAAGPGRPRRRRRHHLQLNHWQLCAGHHRPQTTATGSLSGSFSSVTVAGFASGAFNVVYDLPTASLCS